MPATPMTPPLARSVTKDVLAWEEVDPLHLEIAKDVLGLSPQDRQALGLSAVRHTELQAPTLGGAETALADVLARGGAVATRRKS